MPGSDSLRRALFSSSGSVDTPKKQVLLSSKRARCAATSASIFAAFASEAEPKKDRTTYRPAIVSNAKFSFDDARQKNHGAASPGDRARVLIFSPASTLRGEISQCNEALCRTPQRWMLT